MAPAASASHTSHQVPGRHSSNATAKADCGFQGVTLRPRIGWMKLIQSTTRKANR